MPRRATPAIWAMEVAWSSSVRDVRSVQPVLQALDSAGVAKHSQHRLNTVLDLETSMIRWTQKQHAGYGIGYIALHGDPGGVHVGRKRIDLFELAERLPRHGLKGKVLHFGSCSVLDMRPRKRQELLTALGCKAITGFTEDVGWFESMAFELMLFESLATFTRSDAIERDLKARAGPLGRRLGFIMVRSRPRA